MHPQPPSPTSDRLGQGFSLVELMVAMAIGLLLVAGVMAVVLNTQRSHRELNLASQRIESGHFALEQLGAEIHHAGFYGRFYDLSIPTALPDPCNLDPAALEQALGLPIQGYNDPPLSPLACLAAGNHLPGTDILVIRRATTTTTTPDLPAALYIQSNPTDFVINKGEFDHTFHLTARDPAVPAPIRRFQVLIYFVSPCQIPTDGQVCDTTADDGDPIPTLKRLELADDGTFRILPVAEGVEDLHLEYGLDGHGTGWPDRYLTPPMDPTDPAQWDPTHWADVVAVRIHLLARNVEPNHGYQDQLVYDLGQAGDTGPFGDSYRRQLLQSTVRAINISSRRERP